MSELIIFVLGFILIMFFIWWIISHRRTFSGQYSDRYDCNCL